MAKKAKAKRVGNGTAASTSAAVPVPVRHPRVAILIETSTSWGRRIIEGIGQYARANGPWEFYLDARGFNEDIELPSGWVGDGVVGRIRTESLARHLKRQRIPVVNVSSVDVASARFPRILIDERTIAQRVFDHFRERGFWNFAYCSEARFRVIQTRRAIFANIVQEAGFECHVFESSGTAKGYAAEQEERGRWLQSLPKPIGVVSWNAVAARRTAEACRWAGIAVPEEVAIMAGSSDDLMIEMVHPPISAVEMPLERVGFEAAGALDRMMKGQSTIVTEPDISITDGVSISARQSTDILAVDDPVVCRAMQFIRMHSGQAVGVPELTEHVAVSRRVLERRFQEVIGRSPAQEIRRAHLERARQLLIETNIPIADVATASGFHYVEHFIQVFRQEMKMTPRDFRRRMRPGGQHDANM
jgi:LacI family transcriptional regulator